MPEPAPSAAVGTSLEAALARLQPALSEVADALAQLSPAEWRALMREEFGHTHACLQYWMAFGLGEREMIPERVLGHAAIRSFVEKYPHLVPRDPYRDDHAAW